MVHHKYNPCRNYIPVKLLRYWYALFYFNHNIHGISAKMCSDKPNISSRLF